jgi:cellulose synthase/poly-beta-1,6-N-acetylglucosamine synthase-like glycosyltransferase
MSSKFTIFIHIYYGLPLFREAIEAIQNQTYQNLEIIIQNNGADQEITDFILETQKADKRIKVLRYEKNMFSYDDPGKFFEVINNDSLKIAEGDFIFFQSYDDLMSLDYAERMVKLFNDNSECISAAGLPVSIDRENNIAKEELYERVSNLRPRYMPGHKMILDHLNPIGGRMFSSPGTIFTFRKDILNKLGGFHRSAEYADLYGIVPFGITGFDEEAIFYWRRHEGQLNRELYRRGWVGVKEFDSVLKDFSIKERWSNSFGEDVARYVVSRISSCIDEDAAGCTVICLFTFHFKGALKSFSNSFLRINYWKALPKTIWRHKMVLVLTFLSTFQWVIQPFINILNSLLPSKAPGSGMIKKIQRYYDKGDVTISIISNKEPSQR